ncbi:MAG: LysR family transcriptional regulator [Oscillospiraceae bacterium]|nr:LysR family transcriptional regulator [Oscillospiraceae bacterium]
MDFRQLLSFTTVVELGSFTKAAEKLAISQPTISTHIRALEEELNARLILRTTKSIEVTPKGRELCEYATKILELRDRMVQCCSPDSRQIIHLGASTIPAAYILPEVLPKYAKLAQDTYFIIHQDNSQGIISGLQNGLFDIGLTSSVAESEELTFLPFCQDRMIIITPVTEHFLQLQQSSDFPFDELLQQPVILREKGSKKGLDRFLEKMNIDESNLNVSARLNDQEAVKNMVASGMGISFISEIAARNFLKERRLLKFELPAYRNQRNLYLAYRKEHVSSGKLKDFISFMEQYKNI